MLRDEERVLHAIQFLLSIRFILNVRPLLCINISLRRLRIAKEVDNIEDVLLSLEQKSLIGKGKTLNYDYYIVKNNSKSKVMEHFEKAIKEYLDDLAKKDKLFAEKYANKDKSIKDCCNFIVGEIKKMADKKNMIGCTDDVVYGLAIHYYDEEFDKPATPVSCKVVINRELTEEEKAEAEEKARQLLIEKEAREIAAKEEAQAKREETARQKRIEQAKERRKELKEEGQFTLF